MSKPLANPAEDALALLPRFVTKLRTIWLRRTYGFAAFGKNVVIHYSCFIEKSAAAHISIGDNVYFAPDVWLNVAPVPAGQQAEIMLGNGCQIGRRSTISCRNRIILEADVLLAPSVLIMDHSHEFGNIELPIHAQGVTSGG